MHQEMSRKVLINVTSRPERILIYFTLTILVKEAKVYVKMHLLLSSMLTNC